MVLSNFQLWLKNLKNNTSELYIEKGLRHTFILESLKKKNRISFLKCKQWPLNPYKSSDCIPKSLCDNSYNSLEVLLYKYFYIFDYYLMSEYGEKIIYLLKIFKISKYDKDSCVFNLSPDSAWIFELGLTWSPHHWSCRYLVRSIACITDDTWHPPMW